jgi:ABC-type nitrate/sulfonate/bicarbonate transport system substrate-binding protein
MRALRRTLLLGGLASLLVAGVGCAPAPAAAPAAPQAAAPSVPAAPAAGQPPAAAPPSPVTLSYGITGLLATYWPSFVGMNRGFFADQGIMLDIVLTESSARAGQTIAGGSVDISNHSPETTILAVEKGADLVIVGEEVARPVYTILGQPNIPNVAALRGQKVAVSDLKGGATFILLRTLDYYGVRESDVDIVPVGGTPARFAALKNGAVAAGAMLQPDDFRAMDEGFTRLAVSSEAVKDYTFNSITVQRGWAREHSDELVRFLRAFSRAVDWIYDPANKEEAIAILAERSKQDEKYARLSYDLVVAQEHMYAEKGRIRPAGMQAVLELLAEIGEMSRPLPPVDKYIDTSYWERAQR